MKTTKEPKADLNQGDLRYVPLDLIVDHPEIKNRELIKEHVEELVESVGRNGLDIPLLCWPGGPEKDNRMKIGSKEYPATFLVAGGHRRSALNKLRKLDKVAFEKKFPNGIPCKMVYGELQDALAAQLRENLQRENPSAADVLPYVLRLKNEFGLKNKAIAKRIGRSDSWVSEVLSIQENLGEEATKDLADGSVGLTDALKASKKVKKGKASKEEALAEAREKGKKKKDKGRQRAEKRYSAKRIFSIYKALPNLKIGVAKQLLEAAFEYVVGDRDDLPAELTPSDDQESETKPSKKKAKK